MSDCKGVICFNVPCTCTNQKNLEKILEVKHTALIFSTRHIANLNLKTDWDAIKKANGKVTYHHNWNVLQMGLNPITWIWYMSKDKCMVELNARKWNKIAFGDFEADAILKEFVKSRLALKNMDFKTKSRMKGGIL